MNLNTELKFVLQRLAELDARITMLELRPLPPAVGVEVPPPPEPKPKPWYYIWGGKNG